jgi:hypothetical protein
MRKTAKNLQDKLKELNHSVIADATFKKFYQLWWGNFQENLEDIGNEHTIQDFMGRSKSCIVIGSGPSMEKNGALELLARSRYEGLVVVTDSILKRCFDEGVKPDIVVSVDGNPIIADYYRGLKKRNPKLQAFLACTIHPDLAKECRRHEIPIYWWLPIVDDYEKEDSMTAKIQAMTRTNTHPEGLTGLVTGGNCGASCWVIAHSMLGASEVVVLGLDFAYQRSEDSQYYKQLIELANGNRELVDNFLAELKIENSITGQTFATDHIFFWYRENFLTMVKLAKGVRTINCTEGGLVFGDGITWMPFKEFLAKWKP